jgi:small-conductance mechanosensitive channel
MIDLWEISDNYTLRLINVILLVVVVVAFYYGRKLIAKRWREIFSESGITIKGKEFSLKKLINQVLLVFAVLLSYAAMTYGNEHFTLSNIFKIELFSFKLGETRRYLRIGQIFSVFVLVFLTKVIMNVLRVVLHRTLKNKEWIDEGRRYTIIQMTKYVLYTLCIILVLKVLFGDISSILMGGTALFVGLGLGLQEFFTDVVSGFILLNDGSIQVGDIVELEGHVAKIEKINIRTSHVRTTEGKIIIVPNSKFTEEYLTNWSVSDKVTRFHVDVSVAYGTDTALVKDLLYRVALQHPMVEKEREILILFNHFGDNGLEFQLYFWAKRSWDILTIKSDIRFAIDKTFRENNIKIPYPQRDLHIISDATKA